MFWGEPHRLLIFLPYHSLKAFALHPLIANIILVVAKTEVTRIQDEIRAIMDFDRVLLTIGGATRQESVLNGFRKLGEIPRSEIVLVHDGARPFVKDVTITDVIRGITSSGSALAAIPVVDTIKRAVDGNSMGSISRENLWRAQTPQGANYDLLQVAFEKAMLENYTCTDEAELLERSGAWPLIVLGDEGNRKVTFRGDI